MFNVLFSGGTHDITDSVDMSLSRLLELVMDRERPGMLQSMGSQSVGHD